MSQHLHGNSGNLFKVQGISDGQYFHYIDSREEIFNINGFDTLRKE